MRLAFSVPSRVILSNPTELGGDSAISEVSVYYQGNCSVIEKYTKKVIATLPNVKEAELVAGFACTKDGGFGSTVVIPSVGVRLTHKNFNEWMLK